MRNVLYIHILHINVYIYTKEDILKNVTKQLLVSTIRQNIIFFVGQLEGQQIITELSFLSEPSP